MRLSWQMDSGRVSATHPVFHDGGMAMEYSLDFDGEWHAMFEGVELAHGTLVDCITACQRDAATAIRTERKKQLLREISRLERSDGGNWRRLKRLMGLRGKLDRM